VADTGGSDKQRIAELFAASFGLEELYLEADDGHWLPLESKSELIEAIWSWLRTKKL
jgi:hypothetical protein